MRLVVVSCTFAISHYGTSGIYMIKLSEGIARAPVREQL